MGLDSQPRAAFLPFEIPIKAGDSCPKCGHQLRPDIVWFGEPVSLPYEETAEWVKEVKYHDGVFICVGTSAEVYPAASLLPFFAQVKDKYIVDKKPKKIADYTLLAGNASERLPELVEELLK